MLTLYFPAASAPIRPASSANMVSTSAVSASEKRVKTLVSLRYGLYVNTINRVSLTRDVLLVNLLVEKSMV